MEDNTFSIAKVLSGQQAVNARNEHGQTALFVVCNEPDIDVSLVHKLLLMGAHVNARTRKRWTALHACARHSTLDVMTLLISSRADINRLTNRKMTPLMIAVHRGHEQCAGILIARGADVNARDMYGRTAVHWAIKAHSLRALLLLQQNGADLAVVDFFHKNATLQCVKSNAIEILRYLVANQLYRDLEDNNRRRCMHMAAELGRLECLQVLLDAGMSVNSCNSRGKSPLMIACWHRQLGVVRSLLAHGADVNAVDEHGSSALMHLLLCRIPIRHRPIAQQHTIWMRLAMELLRANADLSLTTRWPVFHENLPRDHEQNALEIAVKAGFVDFVQLFLLAGSEVGNIAVYWKNQLGEVPQSIAQHRELLKTVQQHFTHARSLKDLCRFVVRKLLTSRSKSLSDSVQSLPVPAPMKSILLLEDLAGRLSHYFDDKSDTNLSDSPDKASDREYEVSTYDSDEHCDTVIVDTDSE